MSPCVHGMRRWIGQQAGHAQAQRVIGTGRPVAEVGDEVAESAATSSSARIKLGEQDRLLEFRSARAGRSPHGSHPAAVIVDRQGFFRPSSPTEFPAFGSPP